MKEIGILLPCYNEEENVMPIAEGILDIFQKKLQNYSCTIIFIDNHSTDSTRDRLRLLCEKYSNVKAIFNASNFRWSSFWHGIINTPGDAIIYMPADFQVPLSVIPKLVGEWEKGKDIVCLIKDKSMEKKRMWRVRQLYYKLAVRFSEGETLPNLSGGMFDRKFIDICKNVDDPLMYLSFRAFICEYGYNLGKVYFTQEKRKAGKSSNSFFDLCHIALMRFTETSYVMPTMAFMFGCVGGGIAIVLYLLAIVMIIIGRSTGIALVIATIFLVGSVNLCVMAVLGEYIIKIHKRTMRRPLVIEDERINFRSDER